MDTRTSEHGDPYEMPGPFIYTHAHKRSARVVTRPACLRVYLPTRTPLEVYTMRTEHGLPPPPEVLSCVASQGSATQRALFGSNCQRKTRRPTSPAVQNIFLSPRLGWLHFVLFLSFNFSAAVRPSGNERLVCFAFYLRRLSIFSFVFLESKKCACLFLSSAKRCGPE